MKGGLLTSPGQSDHETSVGQFKQEPISPSVVPASTSMLSGLSESFSHSQDNSNSNQQGSDSNIDTHMIKQEAGVEDEEDLEITGVEMGEGMAPENWGQRAVLGSSQESGLELEGSDQAEYSKWILLRFLAPLAVGQRAYVMARCPSCVRPSVHPSVRALTFSLNIFFAETTYRILMKFHRNVPTMVLFRIS